MPIFPYICENCLYMFEVFRQWIADDEMRCPRCGAARLERLIPRRGRVGNTETTSSCSNSPGIV